ncbi:14011_t:CDS:1 [Dentiscutata erythropus]|uniref:14011_t:CDS:1 n=1 Tax=Dentiscutata erythropus TaxID=1348616 RepID=A0A9N9EPN0_9GLOM|nr:14011_t:CDS:1 [Dentiscutata erythropus]
MESSRFQFSLNITHSFYEEFLRIRPPCELAIKRDELISPSVNSRNISNHIKDPKNYKNPRPLNSFMLFRKNYQAKLKSLGVKNTTIGEVSSWASKIWEEQPTPVKNYFEIAAEAAKEIHKEKDPTYRYSPKKNRKTKSNKISKKAHNNTKVEINRSPFPDYDQRPDVDIPRSNNLNGDPNEDEIFFQNLIKYTNVLL